MSQILHHLWKFTTHHAWLIAALALVLAFVVSILVPIPGDRLSPLHVLSLRIVDRNGEPLRDILSSTEGRAFWLKWEEMPEQLVNATIAAEDNRFYHHPGIDPLAVARASWQNLTALRIVSGGSTITQQVVRNLYHIPRSLPSKFLEVWYALRLERTLSKRDILLQYLNRVPYGNGTFGVEAASRLYFDKPAAHLSIAEAAFLAALPNSPGASNPYRSFRKAQARQQYVLKKMFGKRYITEEEYERALVEPISIVSPQRHFRAPHFTEMVLGSLSRRDSLSGRPPGNRAAVVRTTLDYRLQQTVEVLLKGHVAALRHHRVTNGAVVVIDNATCDILALAGSVDFFDSLRNGQVNGALARRQPGSALKPFTYALGLESGLTAAEILPDIPFLGQGDGGTFNPENYDRKFHGPVRLRNALACSYNVPAVRVAERVGVARLLGFLQKIGLNSLDRPASYYGLALTLGDGEVSLLELTRAYSALARGGLWETHRLILDVCDVSGNVHSLWESEAPRQVVSPQVAYVITDVLRDNVARTPAFGENSPVNLPFPCAVKTGTSKDYRDNWTIGYTPRWTVGVWVGNFDGKPMRTVSGITGAGPLFRDIMLYLEQSRGSGFLPSDFAAPVGVAEVEVCAASGQLPNGHCPAVVKEVFVAGTEPRQQCSVHQLRLFDRQTGRPAGPSTPASQRDRRVVEVFPPLFDPYFEGVGRNPRLASGGAWAAGPEGDSPQESQGHEGSFGSREEREVWGGQVAMRIADSQFSIISPEDGAVFKIDPVLRLEYQTVGISVAVAGSFRDVSLAVDGVLLGQLEGSSMFRWGLIPGAHEFQLRGVRDGREVRSRPVRIAVY